VEDRLATAIRDDVERLCAPGDRALGTSRNRTATDYLIGRFAGLELATEELGFDVPEWRHGTAIVKGGGLGLEAHPGPFSPAVDDEGPLVVVEDAAGIDSVREPGAVLLLRGEIAKTQFTPRGYPFYGDPDHAAILDALEAARPLAVLAATDKSPMTGAMSPFPLIEEVGFAAPSAYMTVADGIALGGVAGETVAVSIESEVRPSTGTQPIGRRVGSGTGRIVVCAHVDSVPETPGAIDNAAGVAVMLAVADLSRDSATARTIEYLPFNGEDHALAPGEVAWLDANDDLSDVALAINIDAPGLPGAPSAYSTYGVEEKVTEAARRLTAEDVHITEGPQWPASDHMIFAMRGIPAIAVTSTDFATASGEYSHTSADVPGILDYGLLAATARFIAALVAVV
jgi:aminopeptidase YwaD